MTSTISGCIFHHLLQLQTCQPASRLNPAALNGLFLVVSFFHETDDIDGPDCVDIPNDVDPLDDVDAPDGVDIPDDVTPDDVNSIDDVDIPDIG
ncbi:hypothetical protein EW145_g2111 [Phellinidium pouzarii]|uniref:Uncharacterized protein n=1 Tax=Phellinidium pouzarii TaxID=167371 RepID=A0A4S4LC15_9AGAM|nr:hypothetical protein EW145_g2111 [Phellinidium pouzarii]